MNAGQWLDYLLKRGRTLGWIAAVVLAGLVIADMLIPSPYDRFPWESWGGFGALYGFAACVLIIVVSKLLGQFLLNRGEDYYDD